MKVYVVLGYQDLCQNGNIECDGVYGVFSTEELAHECVGCLTEELEYMNRFEIEEVNLDEFGYKQFRQKIKSLGLTAQALFLFEMNQCEKEELK